MSSTRQLGSNRSSRTEVLEQYKPSVVIGPGHQASMSDITRNTIGIDPLELLKDLKAKKRSVAWAQVDLNSVPKPLRSSIKSHIALAKQLERLRKPTRNHPRLDLDSANSVPCRGCGLPRNQHKDRAVKRRCLWVMRLRHFIKKDWADKWSDPSKRRTRMMKAWAARRAKKDQRLLEAIHPHVRTLIGDEELLRRLGRRPTPPITNGA